MVAPRLAVSLATLAVVATAAGCGGASYDHPQPPREARAEVISFLKDLAAGRTAAACGHLATDAQRQTRDAALANFRVQPGSEASRLRQVQAGHARAATCSGALSLLADETRATLPAVARRARTLPLSWFGPSELGIVAVGDEDWVVERHKDDWHITTVNVLPGPD